METISEVKKKQHEFINQKQKNISDYLNTLNKEQIESYLDLANYATMAVQIIDRIKKGEMGTC